MDSGDYQKLRYQLIAIALKNGQGRRKAYGCSPSINPNGTRFTANTSSHRVLQLLNWTTRKMTGKVSAPEGMTFDNQRWSNHPNWIVSQSEGEQRNIILHHVPSDRYRMLTTTGDCERPDVVIR